MARRTPAPSAGDRREVAIFQPRRALVVCQGRYFLSCSLPTGEGSETLMIRPSHYACHPAMSRDTPANGAPSDVDLKAHVAAFHPLLEKAGGLAGGDEHRVPHRGVGRCVAQVQMQYFLHTQSRM